MENAHFGGLGNCDVWFHGSKGVQKSWSPGLLQFSPSKNKTGECPTSMQGPLSYKPLKFKRKRKGSNMMTDQISPTSIHVTSVQKREELARRLRDAKYGQMPVPFPCIVFIGSQFFCCGSKSVYKFELCTSCLIFFDKKTLKWNPCMHATC